MTQPYGLFSDPHYHSWSAFSTVMPSGENSRLRVLLNATLDMAKHVQASGGTVLHCAGDMFHTRGQLKPSVMNPVIDTFREILDMGLKVIVIAGNHDLESKDSKALTNALGSLKGIGVVVVDDWYIDHDSKTVSIAWRNKTSDLMADAYNIASKMDFDGIKASEYDLIIHAPVNGVIMGIPDHGLSGDELAELPFKRIFSGHYHNHKWLNERVCSVGALTHQNWGDVNSLAGYLIVDDSISHHGTNAPRFVDLDSVDDEEEVVGNYVRAKIEIESESEVEELREKLLDAGAAGVIVMPQRKVSSTTARTTASGKIDSLSESIGGFIGSKFEGREEADQKLIFSQAEDVLSRVQEA